MKKLIISFVIIIISFSIMMARVVDKEGKKEIHQASGIHMSETSYHLRYYVDTIIKKCYVVFYAKNGSGIDTIPCNDLKLRSEWEKIITW